MEQRSFNDPWDDPTPSRSTRFPLRDYQEEALAAVDAAERDGCRRQLIVMPTGTGKTVVFSSLIARRGGRALVLAHRDELIQQAADKIRMTLPGAHIGIVKAQDDQFSRRIVVASVQTLRGTRLDRVAAYAPFDTVIVDEAHHVLAKTYGAILEATRAGEPGGPLLIGVTATPDRGDKLGLTRAFDRIVYECPLIDMIRRGYLCDVKARRFQVAVDFNAVRTVAGDYDQGQMERILEDADTPKLTAEAIQKHAPDRRTLVFAQSVSLAYETASELSNLGIRADAIDGTVPTDDRRERLARFSDGRTQALCNYGVLTEGYDLPAISAIAIARPTKIRALYVQMAGRGLRPYPGKDHCLILDAVGVTEAHKLVTAATLADGFKAPGFGRPAGDDDGASLLDAITQGALPLGKDGKLVDYEVDILRGGRVSWSSGKSGLWTIPGGDVQLVLEPYSGAWNIIELHKDGRIGEIARGLDLGYAQGYAEDLARSYGAGALVDKQARWRFKPPSEAQINAALKWRVYDSLRAEHGDQLTSGIVSDAIGSASAESKIRNYRRQHGYQ